MKVSTLKLAALLTFVLFATACQRETPEEDLDFDSAQSISNSESVMDDLDDEAAFRLAGSSTACATVTSTSPMGTYPNTITIDYGTTGCVGPLGHVRKGQIVVEVSDAYYSSGSVRTITPNGFSVDDWQLEGQRTVTNLGVNTDGHLHWSIVVNNASLTDPDGGVGTWSTDRIRTLVTGAETEGIEDDVYEVTGTANGTNRRGKTYTATIVQPLVKSMDCRWVGSGSIEVAVQGTQGVRTLDFGDGTCDNKGTLTLPRGYQQEITLRR